MSGRCSARAARLPSGRWAVSPTTTTCRTPSSRARSYQHPLVLNDNNAEGEAERAEELAGEIVFACLESGGSLTGEHGIGQDKKKYMPRMFTTDDMNVMQLLRCAFDPHQICNPGKIFPTPRLCGERPGPFKMHPLQKAGIVEQF